MPDCNLALISGYSCTHGLIIILSALASSCGATSSLPVLEIVSHLDIAIPGTPLLALADPGLLTDNLAPGPNLTIKICLSAFSQVPGTPWPRRRPPLPTGRWNQSTLVVPSSDEAPTQISAVTSRAPQTRRIQVTHRSTLGSG